MSVAHPHARSQSSLIATGIEASAPFHLGYRRWLDGLRGLAVLLVLGFHLHLLPGGFLGVDIFFVLSGFLITTLLVEEWQRCGAIRFKPFYLRRALRLMPAFAVLLVSCFVSSLRLSWPEAVERWKEILVAGCYLSNWPELHGLNLEVLGHTWSLSLEEQFYLIWPLILWGLLRSGLSQHRILMLVCAAVIASATLRAGLYSGHRTAEPEKSADIGRLYVGLDTRSDELFIGCGVGLLCCWGWLPRSQRFVLRMTAAALAASVVLGYMVLNSCYDHPPFYHGLFTVVALLVAVILVRLLIAPAASAAALLESGPLVGAGRISYALYLFHVPILHWFSPVGLAGWEWVGMSLLAVGLCLAAATLSYFFVERPFSKLKGRLQRA